MELPNPEAVLSAYDARVMEAIEDRLPLESTSIDVGNGRRVIAIRVPNSANKPHSVRHKGHIYFPSRRERQSYPMTVREIKDVVMRRGQPPPAGEGNTRKFILAGSRYDRLALLPNRNNSRVL